MGSCDAPHSFIVTDPFVTLRMLKPCHLNLELRSQGQASQM